ncbi:MAG: type II secretion system protein [Gallionella sp.]|nr:type II secretion system protein [Gallionella sp.]
MTTAEQNYLLLQAIEANRRFILMAYQQNPQLLERADARTKQVLEVTAPSELDQVNSAGMTRQRGISLIELVMYIVIVSVAMAGILQVLNANSTFSADPFVKKQARAIAESLLEEIELHIFSNSGFTPAIPGSPTRAERASFDDVMDYNGFATSGVYPANDDGTAAVVPGLADYNVTVAVAGVAWDNITNVSAVQITVTVNNLNASQVVEAIGYRVDY